MPMKNKSIEVGKIVIVDGVYVTIELFENLTTSQYLTSLSKIYEIGGVGNYLKSKKIDGELMIEILSEQASEFDLKTNQDVIIKPKILRTIKGKIKGKLFNNGMYKMGIYDSPMVFDSVYLTEKEDVEKIYTSQVKDGRYVIGNVVLNDNIPFTIDINRFFASHIAILGNTGSGKSNTLASLYENMFNSKNGVGKKYIELINNKSRFLVIDTNGEYTKSFINDEFKRVIKINMRKENSDFKIPLMCTDAEDWGVMLNATDKTQQPLLDKTFRDLKKANTAYRMLDYIEDRTKSLIKIIFNSTKSVNQKFTSISNLHRIIDEYLNKYIQDRLIDNDSINIFFGIRVYYGQLCFGNSTTAPSIEEIDEHINNLKIRKENACDDKVINIGIQELEFFLNFNYQYNVNAYEINENFIGPLLNRFNSMKNNFEKIFSDESGDKSIVDIIFENKPLAILDISLTNSKFKIALSSLISNKLYRYYEEQETRNKETLSIIIDEAHNYLNSKAIENEDKMALRTLEVFEKIIKEGRKFGVYMTISSQRPVDISPTILSQCHNYVIHRLANPNDINQIYNVVSFVDQKSIDMLSILAPGQAIFSGTAFLSPTLVQVKRPTLSVESETTVLTQIWDND